MQHGRRQCAHGAAAAGITSLHYSSGAKVDHHPHISRMGDAALRHRLHTPAMVAERFNPVIRPWAIERHCRGKGIKEVRCAVIRKLVHIAFGVFKSQTPFTYDPARDSIRFISGKVERGAGAGE